MVLWKFNEWRFKFISKSDKKIVKNIFEIRENILELMSQLRNVHQIQYFLEDLPKTGKILYCRIVVDHHCFKDWTRVDGSG